MPSKTLSSKLGEVCRTSEAMLACRLGCTHSRCCTCRRNAARDARMARADSWALARSAEASRGEADYTVDPVAILTRSAQGDEPKSALNMLREPYRIAVLLHDVEGLSAPRVAVIMRSPPGTAKARIRRGRAALVVALDNQEQQAHQPLKVANPRTAQKPVNEHRTTSTAKSTPRWPNSSSYI